MLDIDGLDLADYIQRVESHFGVEVDDSDLHSVRTLGDLADLIALMRCVKRLPSLPDEQLWREFIEMTSDEFGVRHDDLTRDTRFVEDLNA